MNDFGGVVTNNVTSPELNYIYISTIKYYDHHPHER